MRESYKNHNMDKEIKDIEKDIYDEKAKGAQIKCREKGLSLAKRTIPTSSV